MAYENETATMPEGKIVLTNGNVLDCYPKNDRPEVIKPDNLALDKSGIYLSVKERNESRANQEKEGKKRMEPWMELFLREAFFLYENRDRILSDSRMFLTPTPFQNNLAYSGPSGLSAATLGVYIEWWEACEKARIMKDGELHALTYIFAGSPLTGTNGCSAVDRNGNTERISFPSPFSDIWKPFMMINTRYTEAKQIYQAYSLEETVSILRGGRK